MSNPLFRTLVCLLLVCCLVINVSPIRAKAVDPVTITAAAILGVTILGLSAYCGFVLAPPDVDFIEDVGEEFDEFIQVVISTGGMPDDDDDDTNNPIDDLVDQITSSTVSQIKTYTDAVGDAIKGNTTFYDAAVFGGFAGLMPAFKLFLKWMIQNGWLDRTVNVPASAGFMYYGDLLLPSLDLEDDRDYIIKFSSSYPFYMYRSDPGYSISAKSSGTLNCVSYVNSNKVLNSDELSWTGWGGLYNLSLNVSDVVWSYHDILYPDGSVAVPGSEPSSTIVETQRVEATVILGPLSSSIVNGMEAAGIPLPENVNFVKLFDGHALDGVAALYRNLTQYSQSLADGSMTLEQFQDELTYKEPEQPDETEPSAPTVDPDPTSPTQNIPFDGSLGGTPVADFLSNLGNLIMSPFQWIWNKIQSFFDPWITSIGNWFSDVRADIKSIPDKFETWFTDLIDGVRGIPNDILDGLDSRFPPSEDNPDFSDPSDPVDPDEPVSNISPYGLDLKDYFPFCIPFDIYEFFSVLIAEPTAPQFHWELQDLSGNTYSIDVDLSPWDSFAAVFRRMQLLLFVVGLAAASRKFIKW